MDETKFIWMDGKLVKWHDAKVHVLTHTLHYGAGAFEGIRFYETEKCPAVFKLKEHVDRLFYSAGTFEMKIPFSKEDITKAIKETIKANELKEGYIRPICFFGYGKMGLSPEGAPVNVAIAVWPWGKYLGEGAVKLKISRYMRIHPKSTHADAKICGHYVNSIFAFLEAKNAGYDEALLLDYQGHIVEGPGENFFIVKNGKIFTPPLGHILRGITRETIMQMAKDDGIKVEEKKLKPEDAYNADEAFFTGTAAEVTAIASIDDNKIGSGNIGPVTKQLSEEYHDIVTGKNSKYEKWLSYV